MGNHEEIKKSGLGTAGLVLGIIGVCTSIIPKKMKNATFKIVEVSMY